MKSGHSLAIDSWKMLTMSSSITRGTVFRTFLINFGRLKSDNRLNSTNLEYTRYRKKPAGGARSLVDKTQMFLFNAWYLITLLYLSRSHSYYATSE